MKIQHLNSKTVAILKAEYLICQCIIHTDEKLMTKQKYIYLENIQKFSLL